MEKDKGKDKGTVPVSFFAAAASPAPTIRAFDMDFGLIYNIVYKI